MTVLFLNEGGNYGKIVMPLSNGGKFVGSV